MALIRWQPFREIDTLQQEMNRLFDTISPVANGGTDGISFVPPVELEEDGEAVHLKMEIPGLDAKDLDVQVTADSVAITGERRYEKKTEEKGVTRSEFRYGKFQRVIPMPTRIQNAETKADYRDGILHLTLPKAEEEKNKVFKVTLG